MANKLFQAFIDTAKTIAGYPITVANAVFMRDGSTLDEFSENIPHREDDEDTNIEVPNIDADMLNGHPADYYAKQSDLSVLNNSVTQVNNKIGNTDVSKWGNSLTGAIKAACDKADANEAAIADVNSNFTWKHVGAEHKGVPISYPSEFNELYVLVDYGMFGVYDEVTVIKNFLNNPRTIQRGSSEKTGFELVFGTNNVKLQWAYIETQVPANAEITLYYR